MTINFSEYKPSEPLSTFIETYWTGDFNLYSENQFVQSVVPNGCIELIIHLTQEHCELVKGDLWEKSPEFTLIGLQTQAYEVRFHERVQVFGIRFKAEGIQGLFGVPPAEFTATFESGREVLGIDFEAYCLRLRDAGTLQDQLRLTETYLHQCLARTSGGPEYIRMALETIRQNNGMLSLEELLHKIPISPRQLQRAFKATLGISPKEYMRLARFNAIQKYLQLSEPINLTQLSYEGGFTDQSHFIREYKLLTGTNPRAYLKERDLYIVHPTTVH